MKNTEYIASLKSFETENLLDRWFYRPIGFWIAKGLCHTGITPNMVTIFSIFVGAAAGPLFYYNNVRLNLLGVLALILANILDCVDGQLARLTGIKSKIGRILDGLAGDIWFLLIYIFLALRLNHQYDTWWFFIPAVFSGLSHLLQANITDYYKTFHLYFISEEKGADFQRYETMRTQYETMTPGIEKVLYFFYLKYTHLQERLTPDLQLFLKKVLKHLGYKNSDRLRKDFRRNSSKIMRRWIDWMTFNARSMVLFISVLTGYVWFYFIFEIVILNYVLWMSIRRHERLCRGYIPTKL